MTEFGYERLEACEAVVVSNRQLLGLRLDGVFFNLRHLTLTFNSLRSLAFLETHAVPVLVHLNVQHNALTTLQGAPPTLKVLKCSSNRLESVAGLAQACPSLEELWVADNPFPHPSEYEVLQ